MSEFDGYLEEVRHGVICNTCARELPSYAPMKSQRCHECQERVTPFRIGDACLFEGVKARYEKLNHYGNHKNNACITIHQDDIAPGKIRYFLDHNRFNVFAFQRIFLFVGHADLEAAPSTNSNRVNALDSSY